jgi:hypothetical protein
VVHIVVYEKVRNHSKWLETFNRDAPNRNGSRGGEILQFENEPNRHYVIFEWSEDEAHDFVNFAKTPEMQRVFREAGVLEQTIQICSPSIIINK